MIDLQTTSLIIVNVSFQTLDNTDTNFKRKLSKREKKEQKKKEKLQKLNPNADDSENHVAEKLYSGKKKFMILKCSLLILLHFYFRTSRDIIHSFDLQSRSGDAPKTSAKAGEKVAAV